MNNQVLEPVHPLFMPEDDDDPVQVSEIQISRMENGQAMFAPRVRPASELQSLEQVAAEFGGGTYILIARHDHRITTRRKYVLPGKSKPLYDEGPKEEPVIATPAIDPMMAMMGMGGGGGGGLMPLIMMMFQQQNASADRQTQMFVAMMQGSRESTADEKAAARAELQASVERERINSANQMAMMREMMTLSMQGKGNGGAGEDFTRGVEFMRSFANQQVEVLKAQAKGEDTDWGSILETFGQAMQGFGMLKNLTGSPLPEGVPNVSEVVP